MKFSLLALTLLASPSTFAVQLSHEPVAFFNTYNGAEAKQLFFALVLSGAEPIVLKNDKSTTYAIDYVDVMSFANTALDETAPCFSKSSYRVDFVDDYANGKKISIDESRDCRATKAMTIVAALSAMGGDEVMDCAMGGKCSFKARHVVVTQHLNRTGDDVYTAQILVGSD